MISFDEAKDIYLNDIGFVGTELNCLVEKAGKSNLPILIQGENGTGKSIVAQAIHKKSVRNGRPLVSVHCGVFSPSDLSAEIFGSLTLADSGTLLISGIEKIDPVIQAKLLDVMEGRYTYHIDIRFICITNLDLYGEVLKGNFNENLYYKMAVLPINLVPLRQRKNDISLIVQKIIENYKQKNLKGFSEEALELLLNHSWPGNMRELEGVLTRAIVLSEGEYISARDIVFTKSRPLVVPNTLPLNKQPLASDDDLYYRETIKKFSQVINCILNIDELLKNIIKMILEVMRGKNISLLLLDNSDWEYSIKDMSGLPEYIKEKINFKPSRQLVKLLIEEGRVLTLEELKAKMIYPEYSEIAKLMEDVNADICAPLVIEGFLIGFCNMGLDEKAKNDAAPDLELFYILSTQTAGAIKSALTYSHILEMKDARENILRNIMSGIITVDMKKKITTFNKRAENITGYKVADVLGRDVGIIGNRFADIVSGTLSEDKIYSRVELKIPTVSKEMVSIGMSTSHLKDESDNPVGVIVVFADLSEGARIETQVRRTERLASLTTMATGLAHEIKNPLVSIKTFTHLLSQKFNDHEFRNNYYEVVSKEIERLDNLIEKLVNFSHLGVPNVVNHNIEELIVGTISSLNDEIITKKINIKRDNLNDVYDIFLDIEQMKIVFRNILLNAIESMPRGGDILISVKGAGCDFVEITFKDTGCGISEENLNKVFNPFFTTKYGAVGLGLAIVHQVVEGHNGIIKIKSRENYGTTVSLSLPIKVTNYE